MNPLLRGGYSNDSRKRRFCALTVCSGGFAERRRITDQVEQIVLNLKRQSDRGRESRKCDVVL